MAIDFSPTPAQEAIRQLAREFATREVKPRAAELDAIASPAGVFPWDIYVAGNRLGFNKITIPADYGGLGLGDMESVLVIEELSVADGGVGTTYFVQIPRSPDPRCGPRSRRRSTSARPTTPKSGTHQRRRHRHGKAGDGSPRETAQVPDDTDRLHVCRARASGQAPGTYHRSPARRRRTGSSTGPSVRSRPRPEESPHHHRHLRSRRPDAEVTEAFLVPANTPGVRPAHRGQDGQRLAQTPRSLL